MKQLIIFLLLIILGFICYGQYSKYQRFSLESYAYKTSNKIDLEYHNKAFLFDYYEAIENVNGYIISQWSANGIDVRNPKKNNEKTMAVVNMYTEKLAKVKYYEAQLEHARSLKEKGLTNKDIKLIEDRGITQKELQKEEEQKMIMTLFATHSNLKFGETNALVYEIQKLLLKKGYDVIIDGKYQNITINAIKAFEAKHNLFADGELDSLTLKVLLE